MRSLAEGAAWEGLPLEVRSPANREAAEPTASAWSVLRECRADSASQDFQAAECRNQHLLLRLLGVAEVVHPEFGGFHIIPKRRGHSSPRPAPNLDLNAEIHALKPTTTDQHHITWLDIGDLVTPRVHNPTDEIPAKDECPRWLGVVLDMFPRLGC